MVVSVSLATSVDGTEAEVDVVSYSFSRRVWTVSPSTVRNQTETHGHSPQLDTESNVYVIVS